MQEYKRWYDHDPLLLKVINLLKDYQDELKEQAELFLSSIEEKVSKDFLETGDVDIILNIIAIVNKFLQIFN